MPPRVAKQPTQPAAAAAAAVAPTKPAKTAPAKTTTPPTSAKGAKKGAAASSSLAPAPVPPAKPVAPAAPAPAPVPPAARDETPHRKAHSVDDKTTTELIKELGKVLRKRISADTLGDVDPKDVKSVIKTLNQIKRDAAPKPKGDRAPMNAFFYYQALRHLQVKKNGGPNAKEAERVKQLTEAQPEDKPLAPYMILSKLFNEDEYKKFDAKKKSELDATAKGFSLFRLEKYPVELEDKNKPLADWVALKEAERVAYEKRAKQIANEKNATAAAEKEATKKAKEDARKEREEKKAEKLANKEAARAAKQALKDAAAAAVPTVA